MNEDNEEIHEHIKNLRQHYEVDDIIIEEVYGEYSGGYLNSLITSYE